MNQQKKNNLGLVAYCRAQLGRPYWYGCFGQTATPVLLRAKRKQYPKYYTATDFERQYAQRVHDCIGLIKGYFWSDNAEAKPVYLSNGFPDKSADAFFAYCTRKGTRMDEMPDVPGIAVFMKGHVGVYIGGGQVIEARGHAYGVVMTKLKNRPWTKWAYIEGMQYL